MRAFRRALENEEIQPAPIVEQPTEQQDAVDVEILEDQAAIDENVEAVDEAAETSSIVDTTTTIEDTVQKSVDEGTGIDETTAEVMTSALEHFYDRLGFTASKIYSISTESFGDKSIRLEKSKLVLEELKEFNKFAVAKNNVAQEGIVARLGNTIKLIFNNTKKIDSKITQAIATLQQKGTKEGVIKEPGWGRSFAIIGKKELSYADVYSYMERYNKILGDSKFHALIGAYSDTIRKITDEVLKSGVFAKDDAVKAIQTMSEKVNDYIDGVEKYIGEKNLKAAKEDPSYKMLTVQEGVKLGKLSIEVLHNAKISTVINKLYETCDWAENKLWSESNARFRGPHSADIKAAWSVIEKMNPVVSQIFDVLAVQNRVCYACYQYIKASANK